MARNFIFEGRRPSLRAWTSQLDISVCRRSYSTSAQTKRQQQTSFLRLGKLCIADVQLFFFFSVGGGTLVLLLPFQGSVLFLFILLYPINIFTTVGVSPAVSVQKKCNANRASMNCWMDLPFYSGTTINQRDAKSIVCCWCFYYSKTT